MHSYEPHGIRVHSDWTPTGKSRTRRFLCWTWAEVEDRRDTGLLSGAGIVWLAFQYRWRRVRKP